MAKKPESPTFLASFAPGSRKCVQADSDGEVTIVLVSPETEAIQVMSAWMALKDQAFRVTLTPED